MAKTATVNLTIAVNGDGMSQTYTAPAITNTAAPGEEQPVALTTGDNTIAVPTGAIGVIVCPVAGNTATLKLKGAAGDTGISLHLTNPSMFTLNAQASFILNASAGTTAALYWI